MGQGKSVAHIDDTELPLSERTSGKTLLLLYPKKEGEALDIRADPCPIGEGRTVSYEGVIEARALLCDPDPNLNTEPDSNHDSGSGDAL